MSNHQRIFPVPADNHDFQILDVEDATIVVYEEPLGCTLDEEEPLYCVLECNEEV